MEITGLLYRKAYLLDVDLLVVFRNGAGYGIRTHDLNFGKVACWPLHQTRKSSVDSKDYSRSRETCQVGLTANF